MRRKTYWIFILLILICLCGLIWIWSKMRPVEGEAELPVIVKDQNDLQGVADQLERKKIINNKQFFTWYAEVSGRKNKIVIGEHTIIQGSTYKEILYDLSTLKNETAATEVIIPPGFTVKQIALRLEKEKIVNSRVFLERAKTWEVLSEEQRDELDLKGHPKRKVKYAVEGLLFPDTYFFKKKLAAGEVIRQMIDRFIEQTEDIKIRDGLTPYEWVTLASIIEKEALLNREKPTIAGVFINRMNRGQKIQSCSTVQYLLDKPKARLRIKDIKIKSPYNTYLHKGLPPSPISSPDLASLKAAADPEKHDYYYFVAKGNGTWSHYFSKTYKEHKKYTRLSGNY